MPHTVEHAERAKEGKGAQPNQELREAQRHGQEAAGAKVNPATAPSPATPTPMKEAAVTKINKYRDICSIECPFFCAVIKGQYNKESMTWTYKASIWRENIEVLQPMLRHELAAVRRIIEERGQEWLTAKQTSCRIPRPHASPDEVRDFKNALGVSETLIGHFAERGHKAVLQDKKIADGLGLARKVMDIPTEQARTITRAR
jgi:hypothetical protein